MAQWCYILLIVLEVGSSASHMPPCHLPAVHEDLNRSSFTLGFLLVHDTVCLVTFLGKRKKH